MLREIGVVNFDKSRSCRPTKQKLPPGETVLITEGALKADTVVRLKPNARAIATSGVTSSHSELVKAGNLVFLQVLL